MSIRLRILVTFTLIVVLGGVVQLVIAGSQLENASIQYFHERLETDALIASASMSGAFDDHATESRSNINLQRTLSYLQHDAGHQFLLVEVNGTVDMASDNSAYQPGSTFDENLSSRAARPGTPGTLIHTDPNGARSMFVAEPIGADNQVLGYLVLLQPMAPVYSEINRHWLSLIVATIPVIALVVAASLLISTSISRPIRHLRDSALKMAEGAFDTRIVLPAKDEVGELAHAFNYMADQIEKLLRTQRSFVSNAAHELRNPLMTLKLRIEALQDNDLPAAEHDAYLAELGQEVTHMTDLVNALLVLARVDEGRHEPDRMPYDGVALLHDIARHWRIEAHQAHLDFDARIADDLPDLPIPANDLRLILNNLLGNAVKYTEQGCVSLQAWRDADKLKLQVEDTGLGFAPEEAEQLYTRFYRTPSARDQQIPGIGLGLAIVEAVIDYHQGTIAARSSGVGKGAVFTISLPLLPSAVNP